MQKIILFLILSCAFTAEAQYGYGTGQRQRQRQRIQTPQKAQEPDFNIERYVGIYTYNIAKAAKKSKVKLSSQEGKEFSKILMNYNKSIKEITRINSFLLKSTKEMVDNFQKAAMKSGDFSNHPKVQKKMIENLKPISEIVKQEDKKLDTAMKSLLSTKQYKKWIKYNKKL